MTTKTHHQIALPIALWDKLVKEAAEKTAAGQPVRPVKLLIHKIETVERLPETIKDILLHVEWRNDECGGGNYCAYCGKYPHEQDCALGSLCDAIRRER